MGRRRAGRRRRGTAVAGSPDGAVVASHPELGDYALRFDRPVPLLFTENKTNAARVFKTPSASRFVKDGIEVAVVHGHADAVNPERVGTKAAAHYQLDVEAGAGATIRLRLAAAPAAGRSGPPPAPFGPDFRGVVDRRRAEADAFYADLTPSGSSPETGMIFRQALAGMLWSKQFYNFDLLVWLREHGVDQPETGESRVRNASWSHLLNADVISMPDKWEYPWYPAWDLAFQTIPLALVDLDFAKAQLALLLREDYRPT